MQNLVSKNPVQRFKQGKKLQKFGIGGQNNYKERFPGEKTFYRIFSPRNIALGALKAISLKNTIGKKIINNITIPAYKGVYNAVTNSQQTPQQISQTTSSSTSKKSDQKLSIVGSGSSKGNMFLAQQKQSPSAREKVVTPIDNYYVKGFGGNGLKEEIAKLGGVRAVQQMLIDDHFLEGNLKNDTGADGKWGQNTQDAYNRYLQSKQQKNAPTLPSPADLIQHITNQINLNQSKQNVDKSNAPFIYDQLQMAKEQTEKPSNNQYIPQEIPEQFLAMLTGKYKKGGQLPSRNPIQRFKRNFR